MKVLKFGGTSVGTVRSLTNVKKIVESIDEPCVVVVSALGGLTDKLIANAHLAAQGDPSYSEEMEKISARHFEIISAMVGEEHRQRVTDEVGTLLSQLARIYDGLSLIGDLPARTLDVVVSFGERMSSVIVTAIIDGARRHDSMEFVKTERWFDKDIADSELTSQLIREEFGRTGVSREIVPGFISTDRDSGEITNLGRGGSDFTAALIAAALDADTLEIWTDVDGFMTADPRVIPTARIIDRMSFVESMELCSYGAKVIYPPTIYPVFHKNIPIKILNTFNPTAPGTVVADLPDRDSSEPCGISSMKNTSLFTVRGLLSENVAAINTRTYNALARRGVSVLLVARRDDDISFSFVLSATDAPEARRVLAEEFAPEISEGSIESIEERDSLATIAIVGDNLRANKGLDSRVSHTLARGGVDVLASASGSSATTIAMVVRLDDLQESMRLVHSLLFDRNEC